MSTASPSPTPSHASGRRSPASTVAEKRQRGLEWVIDLVVQLPDDCTVPRYFDADNTPRRSEHYGINENLASASRPGRRISTLLVPRTRSKRRCIMAALNECTVLKAFIVRMAELDPSLKVKIPSVEDNMCNGKGNGRHCLHSTVAGSPKQRLCDFQGQGEGQHATG